MLDRTESQEATRASILAHASRLQEQQTLLPAKRKRIIGKGRGCDLRLSVSW